MNIQIETITLKDGSKIDVIRDVKAVKKLIKRLEKAEAVCHELRCHLNHTSKPLAAASDALCLWLEFVAKHCKRDL